MFCPLSLRRRQQRQQHDINRNWCSPNLAIQPSSLGKTDSPSVLYFEVIIWRFGHGLLISHPLSLSDWKTDAIFCQPSLTLSPHLIFPPVLLTFWRNVCPSLDHRGQFALDKVDIKFYWNSQAYKLKGCLG